MDILRKGLPRPWSYGVMSDGRVFFINDETHHTTWLHPNTEEPVCSGHQRLPDLPKSWERGVTPDGHPYYIDHNKQETTLVHPVTKESAIPAEPVQAPPQYTSRQEEVIRSSPTAQQNMDAKKSPKKKLSSGNLRSPTVKRSSQAPVTLQGWLWKQGSDGLMRWKKRWFVLSDFCLFYYKGPEEEKTLGSILLPSYKISPCTNEGRVLRKFAFKAEHQNMRTYYFAADSKEAMHQWMKAMSLATILQKDSCFGHREDHSEHGERQNIPSSGQDDEDSGFTSYHSRRYPHSPQHDGNSTLNTSFTSDPSRSRPDESYRDTASDTSHVTNEQLNDGYLGSADKYPTSYGSHTHFHRNPALIPNGSKQPLYANAPPKPKRLGNQEPYSPAKGEYAPEEYSGNYPPSNISYPAHHHARREEYNSSGHPHDPRMQQAYLAQEYDDEYPEEYLVSGQPEYDSRYTKESSSNHQRPGSRRNQGEVHPSSQKQSESERYMEGYEMANIHRERAQRMFPAQRPHSADFLDYNAFERESDKGYGQEVMHRQRSKNHPHQNRPKSNTDQYEGEEFWSGSYSQHPPPHTPHTYAMPPVWSAKPLHHTNSPIHNRSLDSASSVPLDSLNQRENTAHEYEQHTHDGYFTDKFPVVMETQYPPRPASQTRNPNNEGGQTGSPKDLQFMRSASARLPSTTSQHRHEMLTGGPYSRDDLVEQDPRRVQQREESMKRLLEWKQRMLQSPLTKKYTQKGTSNSTPTIAPSKTHPPPEEYRKQVLQELANHEARVQGHSPVGNAISSKQTERMNTPDNSARNSGRPESSEENTLLSQPLRKEHESKGQPQRSSRSTSRSPSRSQAENKRVSSSLNRYHNSYSSDDEVASVFYTSESASGSMRELKEHLLATNTLPLTRPSPLRRRSKDMIREDPNVSDSEIHVKGKSLNAKLRKFVHQNDALHGNGMQPTLSAGDLLGKTHEELILLLIQLRRTQAKLQKAIDTCRMELEGEKKLMQIDVKNKEIHCQKVEEITKQLDDYTKQFELTKPLVNLVDNMVKLGSLYGGSGSESEEPIASYHCPTPQSPTPMIEFSRQLQEQRLLQKEQLEWNQLVPDQVDLQEKLQHLYRLDKSLQEESITLTNLQQDKEMLERALIGIRAKANENRDNAVELERLRKQQQLVEKELSKVQAQLVQTTKKLEETAAENAKIEHEIMVLRQKIQQTLKKATVVNPPVIEDVETAQLKAQLEEELSHVQGIMDELSKRRKELSGAVEQLKDSGTAEVRPSPTGVAGSAPLPGRKPHRSTYLETDLDTMETRDVLDEVYLEDNGPPTYISHHKGKPHQVPLYVNADTIGNKAEFDSEKLPDGSAPSDYPQIIGSNDEYHYIIDKQELYAPQDINDADERMKRFYGIIPKEKPAEIKTVRIVKRESERRNKGREKKKVTYEDQFLSKVIEEPESTFFDNFEYLDDFQLTEFQRSMSLPRNYGRASYIPAHMLPPSSLPLTTGSVTATTTATTTSSSSKILPNVPYYYRTPSLSANDQSLSAHERLFGTRTPSTGSSGSSSPSSTPLATPVFKSEAARQIVAETAQQFVAALEVEPGLEIDSGPGDTGSLRRRYKRRHYTISSSQPLELEAAQPKLVSHVHARSRDDLDMERCLRAANTPDIVKSTIKKSENFDETTIDRELGLPQKIVIPERYVEQEEEEELTAEEKLHRLQKAESIRKMLSESTTYGELTGEELSTASQTLKKKYEQEKKQREQLLTLNQLLAQEVKERSKAVAAHITTRSSSTPSPH